MAGKFIQRSRHGTVFYFRRRVPNDLRSKVGRDHIYVSLRTEELAQARRLARELAVATDRYFLQLRYGDVHRVGANGCADSHVIANRNRKVPGPKGRGTYSRVIDNSRSDDMNPALESFSLNYGLTFEFDSRGSPKIVVTDAKPGDEVAIENAARGLLGLAKPSATARPGSPSPTIHEAVEAILASPDLKPTTKKEYKRAFEVFEKYFGTETRLENIQAEQFSEYADYVRAQSRWAPKTQSFYITAAGRLFSFFASRCNSVPQISTVGLKPRRSTPQSSDRAAYSLDELEAVFRRAMTYRESEPAKWWATVVPAFMGTRIEELAQAHLDGDFGFDSASGIHFLYVDEITRGVAPFKKSIKSLAGWRKVPIHPVLVQNGFLEYIDSQRKAGYWTPFQACWKPLECEDGRIKHSHYVSRWGGKMLAILRGGACIVQGQVLPFDATQFQHRTCQG